MSCLRGGLKLSILLLLLVALSLSAIFSRPELAIAQAGEGGAPSALDKRAAELYQQVFSPFCPGRSLNDCPSSKAQDLKTEMRQQLEQGLAPEQVLEQVINKYGEQYRAVPRYAGFGRLVWWAPIGFLLIGALMAFLVARGRRAKSISKVGSKQVDSFGRAIVSADVLDEIERELKKL
jgi:cytochrome c-type biogenesis protein CcmH